MEFTPEQKKVIELRNKNILVSAAAGSGKTAVLVERIIGRVMDPENPVDIDRILTVTFTNAAASEMRERIRKRLSTAKQADPQNDRLSRQLSLIHNANIMTIDSFCVKVLRENFEELSLDPSFRVGDENEVRLLKEEAVDEVLDEAYEEENADFFYLLDHFSHGKDDRNIAESILKLSKEADSRPDPEEWLHSLITPYKDRDLSSAPWVKSLISISDLIINNIVKDYEHLIRITEDAAGPYMYRDLLCSERDGIKSIIAAKSYEERFKALRNLEFKSLPSKRDENVDPVLREKVKNIRTKKKDRIFKIRDELFGRSPERALSSIEEAEPVVRELIRLSLKYRERFTEKKLSRLILDFSDIEHKAYEVLKGDAGERYRDFFAEVMTDEYQDSNSLQEAILTLVAGKDNYFCVGDVKQSIYSFRLAEPEIFISRFDSYENDLDSERILLNQNFRSSESVINAVNSLFYLIMHKETGGVQYDESQELKYGGLYDRDDESLKAELKLIEKGDDTENDGPELEAAFIADRIEDMIKNFEVRERDGEEIKRRRIRYSDFAVLLRSAAGTDETVRDILISRGIPAVTEARSGYFKTREIRDVLNFLSVLDNPRQDIALIALMKSPFGGFDDEELAVLRASYEEGLFMDALLKGEVKEELRKKTDAFLEKINKYREMIPYTPIHELIRLIIKDEYALFVSALSTRAYDNLSLLIRKAADYEKTSYRGLFRFLRYIEKMKKYELDFGEASDYGGGNAVRIMSVHKSKGLEFPVVFLMNTDKRFNFSDSQGEIVINKEAGIGLDITDPRRKVKASSPIKDTISEMERLDCIGEELRILYVALTRAKEKLIVSGITKDYDKTLEKTVSVADSGSFLDLLSAPLQYGNDTDHSTYWDIGKVSAEDLVIERLEDYSGIKEKEDYITGTTESTDQETASGIRKELSFRYPYEAAIHTPSKVSVSELKIAAMEDEELSSLAHNVEAEPQLSEEEEEEREKRKKAMAASAERGTAFHKVMSLIPSDMEKYGNDIESFLSDLQSKGSILPGERALINPGNILSFLKTGLYSRMNSALKRRELFREQPFIIGRSASEVFPDAPDTETLQIQGIIDAFFIENDKIIVIDYKTDRVHDGEKLIKRYRKQLDLYAEALEQLLKIPVSEKIIYSVALGKEIML